MRFWAGAGILMRTALDPVKVGIRGVLTIPA